ncbi:hypothetical protein [Bosea rubneri]|uniref:Uncharacterized protein n=1 Tax=Bosea rubneri TaxID=3075434 RepID=A0ABU3S8M5_9HYPH|nr:hypothetical protein [Bosea sp. ZW T0_25]MDU0340710.1 hypothetical protein [Bosea sp. ZW T0_25]
MVKLFVVLGLALLVGGAYAIFDGWPYRVLERGFTEVILGALSFAAGLLMLSAAAILAEIRRLKALVAGAMTAVALGGGRSGEPASVPAPAPVLPRDEPPAAAPTPGLGTAAIATGAGAIALGGALAGLSKPEKSEKSAYDGEEAVEDAEPAGPTPSPDDEKAAPAVAVAEAEPEPEPEPSAGHDDWLLPPASWRDPRPQDGDDAAEKVEPDFFEAALLPTPPVEPESAQRETLVEYGSEADAEPEPESEPVSEDQTELAFEPSSEVPEDEVKPDDMTKEPAREPGPMWWPQVDRAADEPKQEKAGHDFDDFSALREQLNDALATPGKVPEVEPPKRSLDAVSSWMAPRAWPPVTQPRSSDVLDALEEPAAAAAGEIPPLVEEIPDVAPEPAPSAEDEPAIAVEPEAQEDAAEAEAQEPAPAEAEAPARAADKPSASNEGVVGAYQVGETHFTIYADGSIQARTPDGDYVFGSMDELKTYLASEKSRLESGPR